MAFSGLQVWCAAVRVVVSVIGGVVFVDENINLPALKIQPFHFIRHALPQLHLPVALPTVPCSEDTPRM